MPLPVADSSRLRLDGDLALIGLTGLPRAGAAVASARFNPSVVSGSFPRFGQGSLVDPLSAEEWSARFGVRRTSEHFGSQEARRSQRMRGAYESMEIRIPVVGRRIDTLVAL